MTIVSFLPGPSPVAIRGPPLTGPYRILRHLPCGASSFPAGAGIAGAPLPCLLGYDPSQSETLRPHACLPDRTPSIEQQDGSVPVAQSGGLRQGCASLHHVVATGKSHRFTIVTCSVRAVSAVTTVTAHVNGTASTCIAAARVTGCTYHCTVVL